MTRTKYTWPNILLLTVLGVLLSGAAWSGWQLRVLSAERKQIKEDYSLSNNVTFGLFSVDQWRDRISAVIDRQVKDYKITGEQQKGIQKAVEKQLHSLVAGTVAEINKPQKGLGNKLKKLAFNALVDSADLQAQVRPFALTIVRKISSPSSQRRLKNIAASKIDQLEEQIYDSTRVGNAVLTKYLYTKYKVSDPKQFNAQVNAQLKSVSADARRALQLMIGSVVLALICWFAFRRRVQLQNALFVYALLFALLLLVVGITLPVIEVDARIQSLNLFLLGEKITFINQVLFYQNKSILEIIITLISQPKPDSVAVGILILLFVIILPLLRLLAKGIFVLGSEQTAANKVLRYMTFELGKWDMADVMVVGTLMTFIGLNGILKSQLSALNITTNSLQVITTNGTSLMAGYYVFAGYVLFGILLTYILKRISPRI